MFKDSNLKDLGERCAMTFIQAFLGIVAAGPLVGMDVEPMKAGAAAGVATEKHTPVSKIGANDF